MSIFNSNNTSDSCFDVSTIHIGLETAIGCEELYRNTLVEQYKAIYPAMKYENSDILEEALSSVKTLITNFFKSYESFTSKQIGDRISILKANYTKYISLATKAKESSTDVSPSFANIQTFKYKISTPPPTFDPIIEAYKSIHSDYFRMVSSEDDTKAILKSLGRIVREGKEDIYGNIKLDAVVTTESTMLNKGYVKGLTTYGSKYASGIGNICKDKEKFISILKEYTKAFNVLSKHAEAVTFGDITPNLRRADPENIFYRYEIDKAAKLLEAVNDVISIKINYLNADMEYSISVLENYLNGSDTLIPERT